MTKKQMQARIIELELMVQTLTTLSSIVPIYLTPPAQPILTPLPINPFPYWPLPGPTWINATGGTVSSFPDTEVCNAGREAL